MTAVRVSVLSLFVLLFAGFPVCASEGCNSAYEAAIAGTDYGIGLSGGYGVEIGDPPELDFVFVHPYVTFPVSGSVGESWYRGVLEYKVELDLALIDNYNHRGEAGISPVGLRYNFTGLSGRLVPYLEGSLGAVYINVPKSIQGTKFNFTENAAVGLRYFVTDTVSFDVQARYRHLSNAGIKKPNPGINTVALLVGVSYY